MRYHIPEERHYLARAVSVHMQQDPTVSRHVPVVPHPLSPFSELVVEGSDPRASALRAVGLLRAEIHSLMAGIDSHERRSVGEEPTVLNDITNQI